MTWETTFLLAFIYWKYFLLWKLSKKMFKQEIINSNPLPCKTLLWEKLQLTNILHSNIINSKDLKKRKSQENLWDVIYNNILVFYIVQFNIGNIIFHFTQWRKFIGLNIHIREGVKIIIMKSSSDPEKITHEIMLPRVAVVGACSAQRKMLGSCRDAVEMPARDK